MRHRSLALLLAFLLGFAQLGAQLHALAHAEHDLVVAQHGPDGAPPIGHATDECLAFAALDSPAPSLLPSLPSPDLPVATPSAGQPAVALRLHAAPLSRGPPPLLS